MSELIDRLKIARGLIAKGWTQHGLARNRFGGLVPPTEPVAVCYCAAGALMAADTRDETFYVRMRDALQNALSSLGYGAGVAQYNDRSDRTQQDILDLYDRAISNTESEETNAS